MDVLLVGAFQIVVLIYSVVLHELAHGYAARAQGDHTAESLGRLTLNPLAHLDLFGSIILPVLTKFIGGFMFGYAKPVPYNPYNLRDRKWGPSKVALAGPATNLVLAVVFGVAIHLIGPAVGPVVVNLMAYVVLINLALAVFNILPIPPLDGHWLLMAVLPSSAHNLKAALYRSQWVLLVLVIFVIFPLVSPIIGALFHLLTGMSLF